ncbi:hypothetical protein B6N60_04658 [Richelia sinica FACHB-800]|uniref:Uncharacterized protein n=1 Tax=Richelia sinica FACHB-800 TaxID=1357546 RepID=A0A975Y739_9NOST|nr:hypothetical protein B6N60_04658 [Richelia sinica FACHB-800]
MSWQYCVYWAMQVYLTTEVKRKTFAWHRDLLSNLYKV